jgi:hypothetical protein
LEALEASGNQAKMCENQGGFSRLGRPDSAGWQG